MIKDYKRWIVLLLVSSMLFLIVVDVTVLYTALPRLTHDLNASASEKTMDHECLSADCRRAVASSRYAY
ncbi:multidrug efflux protein [Proteus mirabilis]|uniref:Multidrug efflux protein n=1 Tax=Proteus mirabilis TaxID=584 RepID=A0A379GDY5_PROMI|nr:multidrug efflux protein [Proteus mirabilis]